MIKFILGAVLALGLGSLEAQTVSGSILGTVRDASGAVLPDVKIAISNLGTQLKRETVTNGAGEYSVPQLPPGSYTVAAQKAGFSVATRSNVVLQVDQKERIDFDLAVGALTQNVTVEAAAAQVETDTSSLGEVVDTKKIVDLPLNGRNFMQLATLAPGSIPILNNRTSTAAQVTGRLNLSVNIAGGRDDTNSFLLDGIESRQPWLGTPSILPSVDAIQEFKVQRSLSSAEYGQGTGIINVSMKSGTNNYHGTLFEFLRNNVLDARNFFDAKSAPPFRLNQFGGTIGGPLSIPHLYSGKDKTFFFFNYEGLRTRHSITQIGNFPNPAQLAGNFSALSTPVIDPLTRQPFPGNIIPANRISTIAKNYSAYLPAPNRNVPGADYTTSPSQKNDFDQVNFRMDQQFGTNDSAFVRYSYNDGGQRIPGLAALYGANDPLSGQNAAVQETHIFGPRVVNVAKVGFNRGIIQNLIENTPTDVGAAIGFKNLGNTPRDYGVPTVQIVGYSVSGQPFLNQGSTANLFQYGDTLSIQRGRHNLSVGVDLRFNQFQEFSTLFRQGYSIFAPAFTGNSIGDFLLGLPGRELYQHGATYGFLRSKDISAFFQDDWKVTDKLTLNLGLRYEYNSPWTEAHDRQGFFDTSVPGGQIRLVRNPADFGFTGTSPLLTFGGVSPGIVKPEHKDFAPRIGFAYNPLANTVIRGGYGIFYATLSANEFTFPETLPPFVVSPAISPGTPLDTLFPNVNGPNVNLSGASPFNIDPNAKRPYMQQWNLSVQQTAFHNLLFEVAYAGSKGTHLWERININSANLPSPNDPAPAASLQSRRPFPLFGDVLTASFRENSSYNALQSRIERRFSNGLSFLGSYVWAKSIDTASGGFFTSSHMDRTNLNGERGRSNFDVRNAFVFSHVYELPFGKGKRFLSGMSGFGNTLLSGWQANGILTLLSGEPLTIIVSSDNAFVGSYTSQRADVLANPNLPTDQRTPDRWFNTSDFRVPKAGTFGNSGRNIVDGPGTEEYDFSLFKNTRLAESKYLEFRAELFNLFNHPNFNPPGLQVDGGAAFGKITSARDARELQFGVKLIF